MTTKKSWRVYVGDVFTLVPLLILAVFFFIAGVFTGGVAMTLLTAALFWLTVVRTPEPREPAEPSGPPPGA
jgi:hypothetical protein